MYKEKRLPAEEALAAIKKGSRVFMGSGCGEPQYLVDKLGEQVETVHTMNDTNHAFGLIVIRRRVQGDFFEDEGPGKTANELKNQGGSKPFIG